MLTLDWKEYEQEIETYFRSEYPSARISANVKIPGRLSRVGRQIDLLIEQEVCDLSFKIVVDAKFHKRKIDVKDVEEFLGLVRDVSAHKGVMISTEGYTEAAIQRALADDADVILDVLNFKELQYLTGLTGIPYSGHNGAVVQPPFGWIVDGTQGRGALAFLYERGRTFEHAKEEREFMYVNFWTKKEPACDLQSLFQHQEGYMREGMNPVAQIEFIDGVARTDVQTAIRLARFKYHPGMTEYTGFVDFDGFVFMCVLFSPDEMAAKNLSKLRFVMRKVFPIKITNSKEESKQASSQSELN